MSMLGKAIKNKKTGKIITSVPYRWTSDKRTIRTGQVIDRLFSENAKLIAEMTKNRNEGKPSSGISKRILKNLVKVKQKQKVMDRHIKRLKVSPVMHNRNKPYKRYTKYFKD